jgi:type VI secretion system protein ImpM
MPEIEAPTGKAAGFFGKLPSHGDFISRRLPTELLAAWESWLDAGLQQSRDSLGDGWLQTYLSSPIWCFSASADWSGAQPFAGVLMPGLDWVGATSWRISTRNDRRPRSPRGNRLVRADGGDRAVKKAGLEMSCSAGGLAGASTIPLGWLLQQGAARYSLWSTSGSKTMAACCRAFPGLPPVEEFCRLLR